MYDALSGSKPLSACDFFDIFSFRKVNGFNTKKMLNGQMVKWLVCQLGFSRLFSHLAIKPSTHISVYGLSLTPELKQ
jgi:hypothetical protein